MAWRSAPATTSARPTGRRTASARSTSSAARHRTTVYAQVPLDFTDFPGDAQLSSAADSACSAQDAVVLDQGMRGIDTISTTWYAPLEADWADSEHVATCVVESDDTDGLTRSWTVGASA